MINTAERWEIEAGTKITREPVGELLPRLRERINLLEPKDRLLVEMVLSGAVSRRRAGALLNMPTGTVSRRVQRICARLHDPIVRELMDPHCNLAADHRQIGVEHFLGGLTTHQLARKHDMNPADVRGMIEYVRGWHRGVSTRRR
jgi:hypothetical protein